MSFASDLKKFTKNTKIKSNKIYRATAIGLFTKIIYRTPVEHGRLRGNWQTDIGRPALGTIDRVGAGPAIREAVTEAAKAKIENPIYLTNNLPYAVPIENGSSSQAPKGMVKVTVAEFQREVKKQARRLK